MDLRRDRHLSRISHICEALCYITVPMALLVWLVVLGP